MDSTLFHPKRSVFITMLPVVVVVLGVGVCSALEFEWDALPATPLGGGSASGQFYDYAPSSVLEGGVEYHFYCSNKDPGVVEDHIGLTQVSHADGSILSAKQLVLAPSQGGAVWQHVAGVWDGATGSLTIYVDGVQVAQTTEAGHPALKAFGGFRVVAGSLNPAARQTFHGRIDELRVSNVARDIAGSSDWQSPYTGDAYTVDLYHFDVATDPPGDTNFLDSAAPVQNGYYFDFAAPGSDIHVASMTGFGECVNYGNSTGTGSRAELFPDSPDHDVISNQITIEAWIRPDDLTAVPTLFDSIPARLDLVGSSLTFSLFFNDESTLSLATGIDVIQGAVWDSQHTCDPDIVKGQFLYEGTMYRWAMFYLGEDYAQICCMHNQIGVAFAQELTGPWVKWSANPIIPFSSYDHWGVGQPSAVSVDGAGQLLLFYTQGDQFGTRILKRELDLSDMSAPLIGVHQTVSISGLTSGDGSPVIFHNASFAYDSTRDIFFVTRPRHPFDATTPNFVSSELQIACIDGASIQSGGGSWQVLGHVNVTHSGKARNHNSGIVRNGYGEIPDLGRLKVTFCGADEGPGWLWSYRLYSIQGSLTGGDTTAPVINLNGPDVITLRLNEAFVDPVTAWDEEDGDLTEQLVVTGDVLDTVTAGSYTLIYNVQDSAGNPAVEVTLIVLVVDDWDDDGLPDDWEEQHFGTLDQGRDDDPDGDGLGNAEEFERDTVPTDEDTDDDSMPDGWEVEHDLDPTTDDDEADADGDLLSNAEEYEYGTDPSEVDTDGDGVDDGREISSNTDPLNADDRPTLRPGDVNDDEMVDASDVQLVINRVLGVNVTCNCDINGDYIVNAVDVQLVINAALGIDILGQI